MFAVVIFTLAIQNAEECNAKPWLILSVPRESILVCDEYGAWKIHFIFGKYARAYTTFVEKNFLKMVAKYVEIVEVKSPFPWTMVLCKVRNA